MTFITFIFIQQSMGDVMISSLVHLNVHRGTIIHVTVPQCTSLCWLGHNSVVYIGSEWATGWVKPRI